MAKQRGRKKARGKQAVIAVVAIVLVLAIVLGVCWYFLIYSKGLTIGEFLHSLGIDASRPSEETPSTGDPSGGEVVSGSVGGDLLCVPLHSFSGAGEQVCRRLYAHQGGGHGSAH